MSGRSQGHLKKIAVTGGIGSGKSTLVRELSRLGYPVFDADILVAQVVQDPNVQTKIVELLGDDAFATDDKGQKVYQRQWVRDRVFSDAQARKSLESIIHPAIFARFAMICDQLGKLVGSVWVFYEAALIFESQREKDFDAIVSVVAPEQVRRERLSKSRGLSDDTLAAIFSVQVSDETRRKKSNFIIENSNHAAGLASEAIALVENLRNFFHPQSH